jgi:predicted solute-binding protein
MNLKIEWQKIIINAMSVFVAAIIIGAAGIVWERAMSVDTKVQNAEASMSHLINTLSDKLASYETQLTTQSNQLVAVIKNQTELIRMSHAAGISTNPMIPIKEDKESLTIWRKAQSSDIRQQLTR